MTSTKRNIIANFAGQGWSAFVQVAFVPVYVHLLGIEGYGLIGFFATLQAALQVFDLGISGTMNRELARLTAIPSRANEACTLARTFEVLYWAIGCMIAAGVFLSAPLIAHHWVKVENTPITTVVGAVRIMAILAGLQFPVTLYHGGLMGLQRQTAYNAIKVFTATLAGAGAAAIVAFVSQTVTAFFAWQLFVALLQVSILWRTLWSHLPHSDRDIRFRLSALREVWRFAAGMTAVSVSGMAAGQMDKILLSKLLSLSNFGYYSIASLAANLLFILSNPVYYALFPRFATYFAQDDTAGVDALYRKGTELIAVLVFPVAAVLAVFAPQVITLWTRSPATARAVAPLLRLLLIGTAAHGLRNLLGALQYAYGWTSIGMKLNAALLALLVPALLLLTPRYGPAYAAGSWSLAVVIVWAVGVVITHRRILSLRPSTWALIDIIPPFVVSVFAAVTCRAVLPAAAGWYGTAASILATLFFALAVSASVAPCVRHQLHAAFGGLRSRYA